MKIAVAGKGGSGKTTVAAAMARALAKKGIEVIAVDADANPTLGAALGMGRGAVTSLKNALEERADGHSQSKEHDIDHLLADFAVPTPDGIRLLQVGTIERPSKGCLCCGSHSTLRDVFDRMPADGQRVVLTDLEAGVNDLLWAKPRSDDTLVIVVDPSQKSLHVGTRIHRVAEELGVRQIAVVANRMETRSDVDRVAAAFPKLTVTVVPDDPRIRAGDRIAEPVPEAANQAVPIPAITELADRLWAEQPAVA